MGDIPLDWCEKCGGVWCDDKELTQLFFAWQEQADAMTSAASGGTASAVEGDGDDEALACCLCDMSCLLVSAEEECYACGGVYWFPEIHSCDPNPCPPCTHPCCFEDGSCQDLSCMGCEELGGAWHTEWESCDPNPCPRPEFACCFIDGSCEVTTEELCLELGGDPHPEWPECDGADCPILIGACCFCSPPPDCLDNVFEDECYQMGGVAWFAGEDCENVDCWEYTPAHLDSWGEIKEKYRR